MQKHYNTNNCHVCGNLIGLGVLRHTYGENTYCASCYEECEAMGEKLVTSLKLKEAQSISSHDAEWGKLLSPVKFNKPTHYHQHEIDTIQFLQEGFPPNVFEGFAIGHIIKYIQRYQYKGGREDLVKAADYANRLLNWHDKSRS